MQPQLQLDKKPN